MDADLSGPKHWSRLLLWGALAAISYPLVYLVVMENSSAQAGYLALVTQGLVTFLLLLVGTALAIHWAVRQPRKLRPSSVIVYALLCAWMVVTVAVAWSFWDERQSASFLELLIVSPFFFIIGAPGFAVVALAAWRERRRAIRPAEGATPPRP